MSSNECRFFRLVKFIETLYERKIGAGAVAWLPIMVWRLAVDKKKNIQAIGLPEEWAEFDDTPNSLIVPT